MHACLADLFLLVFWRIGEVNIVNPTDKIRWVNMWPCGFSNKRLCFSAPLICAVFSPGMFVRPDFRVKTVIHQTLPSEINFNWESECLVALRLLCFGCFKSLCWFSVFTFLCFSESWRSLLAIFLLDELCGCAFYIPQIYIWKIQSF